MSEISPTFVNWDETAARPVGGAGGMVVRGKSRPLATDLHIEFAKGGVTVTNKGAEAASFSYGNTQRNSVDIFFPRGAPLKSAPYTQPSKVNEHGAIDPPEQPPPGTSTKPTFTHADPEFPRITKWYWTYRGTAPRQEFSGDPEKDPPERPKRGKAKAER